MLRNTNRHYGSLAKWLHWVSAILIAAMIILGYLTTVIHNRQVVGTLFYFHKPLGIVLLVVMVIRLFWRWSNPRPEVPSVPRWQNAVAGIVHYLLYLSVFVMIFAGWGMSSWGGHSVSMWGITDVALPVTKNKAIAGFLNTTHLWAAWALAILIIVHILAALFHQFILRDGVLGGMLPQKKRDLFK